MSNANVTLESNPDGTFNVIITGMNLGAVPAAVGAPTPAFPQVSFEASQPNGPSPGVVTLSATAKPQAGARIAAVQFFDNGVPVGPALTAAPHSHVASNLTAGAHAFHATVRDNFNQTSTSNTVTRTVAGATPAAVGAKPSGPSGKSLNVDTPVRQSQTPWPSSTSATRTPMQTPSHQPMGLPGRSNR